MDAFSQDELEQIKSAFGVRLRALEELVRLLESHPHVAFSESTRRAEILNCVQKEWNAFFAALLTAFTGVMRLNCENRAKCPADEYAKIQPLLEKWHTDGEPVAFTTQRFQEFRDDLASFSRDHPQWFSLELPLATWFETRIWEPAFREVHDNQVGLCNRIQKVIDGTIPSLIESNYASLTPYDFEHLVGRLFQAMGFEIQVTPKSGDFGVDIVAKNADDLIAIQVKRYRAGNNVGNQDVQRLLGAMQYKTIKANKAILVTSSDFTIQAKEQAKETPIELWNGKYLSSLVKKYLQ